KGEGRWEGKGGRMRGKGEVKVEDVGEGVGGGVVRVEVDGVVGFEGVVRVDVGDAEPGGDGEVVVEREEVEGRVGGVEEEGLDGVV
ncbi:hypothetical protein, partial [Dermacoccus nishinomiyaensis]|uniref:hypothetical protein n=1 Tax=Dermacoccus nishinomiyaensis TaxID=1274 RepID=UPI0016435D7E